MRRIVRIQQRKRRILLDLPASGIEEVGHSQSNAERSEKATAKRKSRGEEELRMHALAGTRQVLADLMTWHKVEEQGGDDLSSVSPARVLGRTDRRRSSRRRDTNTSFRKRVAEIEDRLRPGSQSHRLQEITYSSIRRLTQKLSRSTWSRFPASLHRSDKDQCQQLVF